VGKAEETLTESRAALTDGVKIGGLSLAEEVSFVLFVETVATTGSGDSLTSILSSPTKILD
jgi:hypothetical protein